MALKLLTKITELLDAHSSLGNLPNINDGLDPTTLKARYDRDVNRVKTYNNDTLTEELQDLTLNNSGSNTIGHNSDNITADNVGDSLEEILTVAKEAQAGTIIDGSIEDIKLSNSTGQIKDKVAVNTTNIANKAEETTYNVTVTTTWTGSVAPFTQVISVVGMLPTDNPIYDIVLSPSYATASLEREAYLLIEKLLTDTDEITIYSDGITAQEFSLQLKVVR